MRIAIIAPPGRFTYRYSMMAGITDFVYADHPEVLAWAEEHELPAESFKYYRRILDDVDTVVAFCDRKCERTNSRIALAILKGKRVEIIYV
jgi:hypothetical protein